MAPPGNELTNAQLVEEFNAALEEAEQLLNSVPGAKGEKSVALRARLASLAINLLGMAAAQPSSVRERTDRTVIDL